MDAVVAHVAHAAQDHALRERPRTHVVPGAQLAQHGDQRVPDQRVDLVDQEHERLGIVQRPPAKRLAQCAVGTGATQRPLPCLVEEAIAQLDERAIGDLRQHGLDAGADIAPRRLSGLDVDVHATMLAPLIQQVAQRQERRRLPRLPRRVKHEVALGPR